MALTRNVNGEVMELTAEEEAAERARWSAADAEATKPKPPTLAERLAALETEIAALKAARAPSR